MPKRGKKYQEARKLFDRQELYDADLEDTGEDTSTLVAKPGYSEHETGYAMDFSLFEDGISADYDGTGEYDWINQNCAHYGFILRYPENKTDLTEIRYESWHYRYVGQPHAYYMQQNDQLGRKGLSGLLCTGRSW